MDANQDKAEQAHRAMRAGDFRSAAALWEALLSDNPRDISAWLSLAASKISGSAASPNGPASASNTLYESGARFCSCQPAVPVSGMAK